MHALSLVLALSAPTVPTPDASMQILQIYRDPLTPGREAEYDAVERDAARLCARLGFPNPHLALESLTGPREVWWLNAFASEAARLQVTREYERNAELVAALEGIGRRKQGLTGTPVDQLTQYRPERSNAHWNPAGARFFVVMVTRSTTAARGAAFEAQDGSLYVFTAARTRSDADAQARARGAGAMVFAVRPAWGMPAPEWIAADPEFWRENPTTVPARP